MRANLLCNNYSGGCGGERERVRRVRICERMLLEEKQNTTDKPIHRQKLQEAVRFYFSRPQREVSNTNSTKRDGRGLICIVKLASTVPVGIEKRTPWYVVQVYSVVRTFFAMNVLLREEEKWLQEVQCRCCF